MWNDVSIKCNWFLMSWRAEIFTTLSNLFSLDAIDLGTAKLISITVDLAEWRRIFGDRRREHRSCGDRRLVVCLVNTVNGCRVAGLECWHVRAGRREDWLGRWHRRWTRWRCWAHACFTFTLTFLFESFCLSTSLAANVFCERKIP